MPQALRKPGNQLESKVPGRVGTTKAERRLCADSVEKLQISPGSKIIYAVTVSKILYMGESQNKRSLPTELLVIHRHSQGHTLFITVEPIHISFTGSRKDAQSNKHLV
jgi:hypothetical protein